MAGGITIQKNYINTSITSTTLANNWSVLVLGVTSDGPEEPTLVQTYAEFVNKFGTPVPNVQTHANVSFMLSNGVPVLFKRIFVNKLNASAVIMNETDSKCTVVASKEHPGTGGNNIALKIMQDADNIGYLKVYTTTTDEKTQEVAYNEVESYTLGTVTYDNSGKTVTSLGDLLYNFVYKIVYGRAVDFNSTYIQFSPQCMLGGEKAKSDYWHDLITTTKDTASTEDQVKTYSLEGGTQETNNTYDDAIKILKDTDSTFWEDRKLINASVYYPQLRLLSTGGIVSTDLDEQRTILKNLGKFAVKCEKSFRVLVDFDQAITTKTSPSIENIVRSFVYDDVVTDSNNDPAVYSYFGTWGADNNNNWLPGSTGFLANLGRSGYNVYSRRIAGTTFNPGFTKTYDTLYVDSIKDWQDSNKVQLNPIVVIDAQDNLAVMGSSTLALPPEALSTKNPSQQLDIVMVGDYIAALINNIALSALEASFDRLSLSALDSNITSTVEDFVTSRAITRYTINYDTTQLGKLGIECILYFAIGLEEVSLTVSSVYDTTAI